MKGLALALLLWQAGVWATGLPPYLLPSPWAVLQVPLLDAALNGA